MSNERNYKPILKKEGNVYSQKHVHFSNIQSVKEFIDISIEDRKKYFKQAEKSRKKIRSYYIENFDEPYHGLKSPQTDKHSYERIVDDEELNKIVDGVYDHEDVNSDLKQKHMQTKTNLKEEKVTKKIRRKRPPSQIGKLSFVDRENERDKELMY